MKSIDYPEAQYQIAKDQPQYGTMYANVQPGHEVQTICCLQFTDEQIEQIVKEKKIFYSRLTFGQPFQPFFIYTKNPFVNPILTDKVPADENRTPVEEWDKTHWLGEIKMLPKHGGGTTNDGNCLNCGKEWNQHFWSTRQCEL